MLSGDTDDEGSGWETASDADEEASASGAQAAAAMDAEDGAGTAFHTCRGHCLGAAVVVKPTVRISVHGTTVAGPRRFALVASR